MNSHAFSASSVQGITNLGKIPLRVASIFIHYNQYGRISKGFRILVESSLRAGYCTIFVTTSPHLASCQDLVDKGAVVLIRENIGYDFGSLIEVRDLLSKAIFTARIKRVVVCNNSMMNIGSLGFGSDPILDQLVSASEDLVGITESYERRNYHIQTYHFSLSGAFFFSEYFDKFSTSYRLGTVQASQVRDHAIVNGELELTQLALENNMTTSVLFPINRLLSLESLEKLVILQSRIHSSISKSASFSDETSRFAHLLRDILPDALPVTYGLKDYNPVQSCWLILILSGYLFFKREILEIRVENDVKSRSAHFLFYPILSAAGIDLDHAYDIVDLKYNFVVR